MGLRIEAGTSLTDATPSTGGTVSGVFVVGDPSGAANKWRAMLRGNEGAPDGSISYNDISNVVRAFQTIAYPEKGPSTCP